jgi:hypothetical protein
MKVEGYGEQKVGPEQARVPVAGVPRETGFEAISRAGAGLDAAAGAVEQQYNKYQHEAAVTDARDALTQLEQRQTARMYGDTTGVLPTTGNRLGEPGDQGTSTEGFLATRGKSAAEQSSKVLSDFDGDVTDISDKLSSPAAQKIFQAEAKGRYAEMHRAVEAHVSRQVEQAKADSLAAASDEAVRAAAVDPGNDGLAQDRIASVVGAAHGMGGSEDAINTKTLEVQQRVAMARIDALLARKDVQRAEEVLDAGKWALGAQLDNYKDKVAKVKGIVETERFVTDAVQHARLPSGQVDESAVLRAVDAMPDEAARARAEPIAAQHLLRAKKAYEADTQQLVQQSRQMVFEQGWASFSASPQAEQLFIRNREEFDAMRNRDEKELNALERKQRMRSNNRAAIREQGEIDKTAQAEWGTELARDTNASLKDFLADHPGLSKHIPATLEKQQAVQQKVEKAGLAEHQNAFVSDYMAEARYRMPAFTGKPAEVKQQERDWEQAQRDAATNVYTRQMEQNGGKAPTAKELDAEKARLILKLPPVSTDPAQLQQQVDAMNRVLRGPPSKAPPVPTGIFKTDKNGVRWEKLSDGTARRVK